MYRYPKMDEQMNFEIFVWTISLQILLYASFSLDISIKTFFELKYY